MFANWVHGLPGRFQFLIYLVWRGLFIIMPIVLCVSDNMEEFGRCRYEGERDKGDTISTLLGIWFILLISLWFINPMWFAWTVPETWC